MRMPRATTITVPYGNKNSKEATPQFRKTAWRVIFGVSTRRPPCQYCFPWVPLCASRAFCRSN